MSEEEAQEEEDNQSAQMGRMSIDNFFNKAQKQPKLWLVKYKYKKRPFIFIAQTYKQYFKTGIKYETIVNKNQPYQTKVVASVTANPYNKQLTNDCAVNVALKTKDKNANYAFTFEVSNKHIKSSSNFSFNFHKFTFQQHLNHEYKDDQNHFNGKTQIKYVHQYPSWHQWQQRGLFKGVMALGSWKWHCQYTHWFNFCEQKKIVFEAKYGKFQEWNTILRYKYHRFTLSGEIGHKDKKMNHSVGILCKYNKYKFGFYHKKYLQLFLGANVKQTKMQLNASSQNCYIRLSRDQRYLRANFTFVLFLSIKLNKLRSMAQALKSGFQLRING